MRLTIIEIRLQKKCTRKKVELTNLAIFRSQVESLQKCFKKPQFIVWKSCFTQDSHILHISVSIQSLMHFIILRKAEIFVKQTFKLSPN